MKSSLILVLAPILVQAAILSHSDRRAPDLTGVDPLTGAANRSLAANRDDLVCPDDGVVVTVTAKFWYVNDFEGGAAEAQAMAESYVDKVNEVLKNSEVNIEYTLWGSVQQLEKTNAEVLPGDDEDITPNEVFINCLGDDFQSHAFLGQTADHVVLMYNDLCIDEDCTSSYPNACVGFGNYGQEGGETFGYAGSEFATIIIGRDMPLTFAHEAGHCMGAMHDREAGVGTCGDDDYNCGYKIPDTDFATVMAYGGTEIPYFSNPDVSYDGNPTGTDTENNARALNDNKYNAAAVGNNCLDGNVATKEDITVYETSTGSKIKCEFTDTEMGAWGEWSQCCQEDDGCTLQIPGWFEYPVGNGMKAKARMAECINLLGENIGTYHCQEDSESLWDYTDLQFVVCEDTGCQEAKEYTADCDVEDDVDKCAYSYDCCDYLYEKYKVEYGDGCKWSFMQESCLKQCNCLVE